MHNKANINMHKRQIQNDNKEKQQIKMNCNMNKIRKPITENSNDIELDGSNINLIFSLVLFHHF